MIRLIGAGGKPGETPAELDTFWTVPNIITVVRFLGVPLFVMFIVQREYAAAVITLVLLGSTDWVDGYVARRFGQVSSVGKWLDPVADRTALIVIAVTFVVDGVAPAWLVWTIVIPDAILIINALILFHGPISLPVTNIGKIRTALLLVGSPLLLLQRVEGFDQPWLEITATTLLVLGCIGHLIAFYGYFTAAHRVYRLERSA
ncbi:CDP-diacylglycerol--glycerol-3-phosphate 3-phosphatidyltransferase [Arthrobacter subterraneus]|uniref:CDP-diacylglycerol--glycerol-3-phosphate 3-phosphatidyltransferase n=1 Tax=Arthrobacter subterraneus TaxID=335973 RepID=A0A1G8GH92_9MICC|nr:MULTISPECIES: CDP-alcohol phosphatidyltransferase family protein [Arthrobacter]SDH93742.1 CDP-diacylglycerol--glycerol-3-phosphate 3-phosphatidyltransferase [Arthrobacter subterraneus]